MYQRWSYRAKHWDRLFAPSSCLVMITTIDSKGRVNAASYGSCVRLSHEPVPRCVQSAQQQPYLSQYSRDWGIRHQCATL